MQIMSCGETEKREGKEEGAAEDEKGGKVVCLGVRVRRVWDGVAWSS